MSQHQSLKSAAKDKKIRSVLNRFERIKKLREKDKWEEGQSVFGLPKVKVLKLKVKKGKSKAAEEAEGKEETKAAGKTEGESQQQETEKKNN
jgi:small basic protein (TIGR04137 family)